MPNYAGWPCQRGVERRAGSQLWDVDGPSVLASEAPPVVPALDVARLSGLTLVHFSAQPDPFLSL